jgi:hypothetical protein
MLFLIKTITGIYLDSIQNKFVKMDLFKQALEDADL